MRICHIIEAAGGGSGQVVMDLAYYGMTSGDQVTVIYAPKRAWPKFVTALSCQPMIRLLPLPMERKVGLHDVRDTWRLYRLLKKTGPYDVLHGHSSKGGALTRLAGMMMPVKVKIFYTPHGFITLAPSASRLYRWIEWWLSFQCDRVITVSEGERRHARQLRIPQPRLAVIPNGIRPPVMMERADARRELGLTNDAKVFGFIGRLTAQKNPLLALKAFAQVATTQPDWHLCLIGNGDLMPEMQALRASLPFAERVHLMGPREGGPLIPAFDALVCSSDYEGMPIIFLEALFAGVPIISTPVGGVDEAIVDGVTGFVTAGHSVDELASAMQTFIALRPEMREAMGDAGRERATKFTAEQMGSATRALYRIETARYDDIFDKKDHPPLRVCHVVEATAGGSARIVTQLIQASISRGDDVTLIYSPTRADTPFLTAIESMPKLRRIAMPMNRTVSPADLLSAVKLYKILRANGPFDILHCHSSKAGALTRLAGILMPRAAKVYTPHGFYALTPRASKIYGWIEWALCWFADSIITVSQRESELAVKLMGIPKRKLTIILNGIDLDYTSDRDSVRRRFGFKDYEFVVGFVGRLVEIKNPLRLIETFRILATRDGNIRLVVIGQGPLQAEMELALDRAKIRDRVIFLDNQDARDLIDGFDCLLCTSNVESFGLVLIEALHAGVPVVTTPVGVADIAVINGRTGYIGDFTPDSLADQVMKLVAMSPEEKARMREACHAQARPFDFKTMTAKTHDLYFRLARRKRRR